MTYYAAHRDEQKAKCIQRYHDKTGSNRHYRKGYLITHPDGKQVIKYTDVALSLYMGYSASYLRRMIRNGRIIAGCKIERIY